MLQLFNFEENELRVVMKDDEPWFIAKDVCEVLGISNSRDALKRLDDDEMNTVALTDGKRGNPNKTIINEAGLYSLILSSRKPEAKAFKRWITHEVIPSIRKHGMYAKDELLENPDLLIEVVTKLKEERQGRLEAEGKLKIVGPKVEAFNTFLETDGTFTLTDAAKLIGVNVRNMNEELRNHGILLKKPYNSPSTKHVSLGYFVKVISINAKGQSFPQTRVTPKGIEFLGDFIKKINMVSEAI